MTGFFVAELETVPSIRPRFRSRARQVLAELRQQTRFYLSAASVEDIAEYRQRVRKQWPRAKEVPVSIHYGPRTEPYAAHEVPRSLPGTPWFAIITLPLCLLDVRLAFTKLKKDTVCHLIDGIDEMRLVCHKAMVDMWQDFHECFHAETVREEACSLVYA